jgi:hypothetical protein
MRLSASGGVQRPQSTYKDEELPESPESSPDEDASLLQRLSSKKKKSSSKRGGGSSEDGRASPSAPQSAKQRVLRLVDRVANSNVFQQATDFKPVKQLLKSELCM